MQKARRICSMRLKRLKYGFGEFKLGDAWRYYNVPLERIRNAAQMFGQRHAGRAQKRCWWSGWRKDLQR